jgi:hypothetical protein
MRHIYRHSILLLCCWKCFALLLCQANSLLCPLQVVLLRDVKSCYVEVKKERQLLISVMHLHYNEAMLCIICESFAKIRYTVKLNSLFVLPIQLFERTEWMLNTQIEHHNKQNVPISLCTIQAIFTVFWKQRRLGRRKNLWQVQDSSHTWKSITVFISSC